MGEVELALGRICSLSFDVSRLGFMCLHVRQRIATTQIDVETYTVSFDQLGKLSWIEFLNRSIFERYRARRSRYQAQRFQNLCQLVSIRLQKPIITYSGTDI